MPLSGSAALSGHHAVSAWLEMNQEHVNAFGMGSYLEPVRPDLTFSQDKAFEPPQSPIKIAGDVTTMAGPVDDSMRRATRVFGAVL